MLVVSCHLTPVQIRDNRAETCALFGDRSEQATAHHKEIPKNLPNLANSTARSRICWLMPHLNGHHRTTYGSEGYLRATSNASTAKGYHSCSTMRPFWLSAPSDFTRYAGTDTW